MTSMTLSNGDQMLKNEMRVLASETGFTIIDNSVGFAAYRLNDNRYFLFCLWTGEWAIYEVDTGVEVTHGRGATSFLAASQQYFKLRAKTADAVQIEYAA